MKQIISLFKNSKRLDFNTSINWKEKHRMLRVSFPVNIQTDFASFDIQYGCINRSTHNNNSWKMAQFEVAGQKFADLSNNENGVALLNNCKYGYMVKVMFLT